MTTRDTPWAPGTPCWVDHMSTDGDAARAFYSGLFGWTAEAGPPEAGGYTVATIDGHVRMLIRPSYVTADCRERAAASRRRATR